MLQKLSIMLLSSAQKATYYAFEKCPLLPKLCHHRCPIMYILYHLIDVLTSNSFLFFYLVATLEYFVTM